MVFVALVESSISIAFLLFSFSPFLLFTTRRAGKGDKFILEKGVATSVGPVIGRSLFRSVVFNH